MYIASKAPLDKRSVNLFDALNANDGTKFNFQELASNEHICSVDGHVVAIGRSYLPSDIGTDIDDEDAGVCPDNPEEDADAIHLLQAKAICVDESGEASYLSGFIGIVLFKAWKVFANNEADVVKEAGKGGYCPYIAINGGDDWIFNQVDEQNIPAPPTYNEVVAAPKFRNVRFKSASSSHWCRVVLPRRRCAQHLPLLLAELASLPPSRLQCRKAWARRHPNGSRTCRWK